MMADKSILTALHEFLPDAQEAFRLAKIYGVWQAGGPR